MTMHFNFPRY